MRVLAIDPGYDRMGLAVIEKKSNKEILVYSSCLITDRQKDFGNRLLLVGKEVAETIKKFQPEAMAIESLFMEKNQKTGMRVSEARGVILYEAAKNRVPVMEFTPLQVKSAVTGDGRSDKTRIARMLPLLITLPKKKMLDDEMDAVALGLTFFAYGGLSKPR